MVKCSLRINKNFPECADQTCLGISSRWHVLRFDGVTDTDRFREGDPRQDEGMQKKWYRKKKGKGGNIQWNESGWKMNC